jgi:stage II sporulation protein D
MIRPIIVVTIVLFIALLVIPALVIQFVPHGAGQAQKETVQLITEQTEKSEPLVQVAVYRTKLKTIEKVPLELYIQGVVASEMPAEFELEALKAQALAARTYIIRRLIAKDFEDSPEGSVVTDTEKHQVYQNEEELRERWGLEYERKISRINQAVNGTVGQVLTFDGRPINATFFSTSNGYTENSEDYWTATIPYLRSVESPWDEASPRFKDQIIISIEEFQEKLGVQMAIPASTNGTFSDILSTTTGKRVKEVKVGDNVFTGKEVREKLGLSSSHFTLELNKGQIIINTLGWGHGVGMSQWGANGMAQEGHNAEAIVKYYYKDIQVQDYREWIVNK